MDTKSNISAGYAASAWRFLASLKLTVVVLLCLAALSVIGTIIVQNGSAQEYVQRYGLFWYQVFLLLDIVDMYHSWWFVGLMLLLGVNIIVCSVDRLQSTWRVIFDRDPRFDLAGYRNRKGRIDKSIRVPAAQIKPSFERFISRRYRYCRTVATDKGFAITAERGRWTRLGVYGVHLSIVVLLLGGLLGARLGFEGFMRLAEGQTADTITLNRSGHAFKLPFAIRCDDFNVQFYEGGRRPKEFRSTLTIIEKGQEILHRDIVVNGPLYYKGIGIYQSSYEPLDPAAPSVGATLSATDKVQITFQSTESGILYTRTATIGQSIEIPEGLGVLTLERFEPDAKFQSMSLGPALIAALKTKQGGTQSVTLPLRFPKFDTMRRGQVIISAAAKQVMPMKNRYATGLQVVYDPGVWVVYAGFIMMILGCAVVFFMSHRQIVVEVADGRHGTTVMVSGKANKNKVGFQLALQRTADHLEQLAENNNK